LSKSVGILWLSKINWNSKRDRGLGAINQTQWLYLPWREGEDEHFYGGDGALAM